MNSNPTPFKKRNNPFGNIGGTSILDETPEQPAKVEEKPKPAVQKTKVVVAEDNNREKYTATMEKSLRKRVKIASAMAGIQVSTFIEEACKEKLEREEQ